MKFERGPLMSWPEIFMADADERNAETRKAVKKARAEAYAAPKKNAEYQRRHRAKMRELRKANAI